MAPEGVDAAPEPVGAPTLPDTLRAARLRVTVSPAGMLSSPWAVREQYPIDDIPRGVWLADDRALVEQIRHAAPEGVRRVAALDFAARIDISAKVMATGGVNSACCSCADRIDTPAGSRSSPTSHCACSEATAARRRQGQRRRKS